MEKTTEQKILHAARQEFIETGLGGARMYKIAERAGVNKELLHYYFRSKENLYEASLKEVAFTVWSTVESQLSSQAKQGDLREFLRSAVNAFFTIMASNPEFPNIIFREIADGGKIFPALAKKVFERFETLPSRLNEMVHEEITKGTMYPFVPLHIFINIMGMCVISFFMQPIAAAAFTEFGNPTQFGTHFYQARIDAILEMTFHGLFKQDTHVC